jgi:uncharacterized RDD family membrane protein YckC
MASAAKATISTERAPVAETIVGFSAEELRAPFMLRCAAMSIDYLLLIILPAAWLMISGSPTGIGTAVWTIAISVFVANFLILPLLTGRSLGKFLTGLTIVNTDGTKIGVIRLLMRNTVGYLITVGTGGLGFVVAAFSRSGRSLHDILTGTVVIRGRKTRL